MKLQQEINTFLQENKDENYLLFNQKTVSSKYPMVGIRLPILKQYAKELSSIDPIWFTHVKMDTYEKLFLYGYSLCFLKIDWNTLEQYLWQFFPYLDNWAVTDSTCAHLKQIKKYPEEGYQFILSCLKQKETYTIRFGLVLLLDYYINDIYIDRVLELCNHQYLDEYYVSMAHSWLISICYIEYPEKTEQFFKQAKISTWVHNKAISKICDSSRISKETKERLKKLRK